jgi:hypothetical protein
MPAGHPDARSGAVPTLGDRGPTLAVADEQPVGASAGCGRCSPVAPAGDTMTVYGIDGCQTLGTTFTGTGALIR